MFQKLIKLLKTPCYLIRSILFYCIFSPWTACYSTLVVIYALIVRHRFNHQIAIKPWAVVTMYLIKWILGISWKINGKSNIPKQPCVILSNHQSAWETFCFQALFSPQVTVLKKELLKIPFFGQALAQTKPIAIDRSNPKQALEQLKSQGKQALSNNNWVLIFPEGTRAKKNSVKAFSRGGAYLAKHADVPVLVVAQNSGNYWINKSWIKKPGEITINIFPTIDVAGKTAAEITDIAYSMVKDFITTKDT